MSFFKFGQRNNLTTTTYVKEPKEFFDLLTDPSKIVQSVTVLNDLVLAVNHCEKEEFAEAIGTTTVVIAAYTTSIARLHLYNYIEKLGNRLLYFDTDSIIYLTNPSDNSEYKVPIGSFLGEMTNELKDYGADSYIKEFVSAGPKNYAMKIYSTEDKHFKYVTKIRGFTLDSTASKRLNFKSLKNDVLQFVQQNDPEEKTLIFPQIVRTVDRKVLSKMSKKKYRVVYDKRVVRKDATTVPYGWN